MVFHDGLSCSLPMVIVRYMYTVYHYFLFSFGLLMFIIEWRIPPFSVTLDLFLITLYNYVLLLCVYR